MEKHIRVRYLLMEGKRQWKIILIIAVILALAISFNSYRKTKNEAGAVQYASTCSFIVREDLPKTEAEAAALTNRKDQMMNRLVKSDGLIELVLNDLSDGENYTADQIKNTIYSQGYSDGRLFEVYVLSGSQQLSDEIATGVEKHFGQCIDPYGYTAETVEKATAFGPASISQTQIPQSTEKTTVLVSAVVPTVSIVQTVKKGVVGFVFGGIIAYILICVLYILKDSAIYDGELEDAGVPVLGVIREGKDRDSEIKLAITTALMNKDKADKLLVLGCGTEVPNEEVKGSELDIITGRDIKDNPEDLLLSRNADAAALYLKSDTVKISEVKRLAEVIDQSGCRFTGVIFEY